MAGLASRLPGEAGLRRAGRPAAAALLTLVLVALASVSAARAAEALEGRQLQKVLHELQEQGLDVVWSNAVVPPDLRVVAEPTSRDPAGILSEILAPHGLAVRATSGGRLAVVRAPAVAAIRELRGEVRSSAGGEPIAGARLRLGGTAQRAVTDRQGRFRIVAPSSDDLTLQVDAAGYRSLVRHVAAAAETLLALELQPLPVANEHIEVTSTELAPAGAPVTGGVLDRVELERQPELAGDPLRAAGQLPGVTTEHSARPLVRGGEVESVGIEVDGVELYEPYHLLDYGGLISIVPTGVLSELEVDTGSVDASRGDRLSGVLDMTTLSPDWRLRGAAEIGPLLAGAYASGQGTSGRYRWLGSARLGLLESAAHLLELDQEPRYWDAFLKGTFDAGASHELALQTLWSGDRLSAETLSEEDQPLAEDFETRYGSRYIWLSHRGTLGSHAWVEQRASVSEVDGDRDGASRSELDRFHVLDDRRLDVFDLRHEGYVSLGSRHELQWGGELRQINADFDYADELELGDPVAAVRTNPAMLDSELSVSLDGRQEAVYLQDRWHASPTLTLLGGLRWENGSLWGERLLHPRLQIAHQLTERDRWSLAWGRYSQSQRPYELSIEDGERELRPLERAEEVVLGWDRRLGRRFRLTSEAFHRTVAQPQPRWANLFDPFSVFPENEPDRVLVEVTDVRTLGAAVSLAGRFSKQLEGSLALSGTSVRERVAGDEVTGANDRPLDVRLRFAWDPSARWSVRFAWRYGTGAPTTPLVLRADENGEVVPTLGPLRVDRLPDYHALDLEVARGWRIGDGRLELLFDVENAYGHANARGYEYEVLDDLGPPRIERETQMWPGVVPSFRVRFEF